MINAPRKTKKSLVSWLVNDDLNTCQSEEGTEYLVSLLRQGFKGYNHMTIEELRKEYLNRTGGEER